MRQDEEYVDWSWWENPDSWNVYSNNGTTNMAPLSQPAANPFTQLYDDPYGLGGYNPDFTGWNTYDTVAAEQERQRQIAAEQEAARQAEAVRQAQLEMQRQQEAARQAELQRQAAAQAEAQRQAAIQAEQQRQYEIQQQQLAAARQRQADEDAAAYKARMIEEQNAARAAEAYRQQQIAEQQAAQQRAAQEEAARQQQIAAQQAEAQRQYELQVQQQQAAAAAEAEQRRQYQIQVQQQAAAQAEAERQAAAASAEQLRQLQAQQAAEQAARDAEARRMYDAEQARQAAAAAEAQRQQQLAAQQAEVDRQHQLMVQQQIAEEQQRVQKIEADKAAAISAASAISAPYRNDKMQQTSDADYYDSYGGQNEWGGMGNLFSPTIRNDVPEPAPAPAPAPAQTPTGQYQLAPGWSKGTPNSYGSFAEYNGQYTGTDTGADPYKMALSLASLTDDLVPLGFQMPALPSGGRDSTPDNIAWIKANAALEFMNQRGLRYTEQLNDSGDTTAISVVDANGNYAVQPKYQKDDMSWGMLLSPIMMAVGAGAIGDILGTAGAAGSTGAAVASDPLSAYLTAGASDASTIGGLGGYAGSVGAGAGAEVLGAFGGAAGAPSYSTLTDAGYSTPTYTAPTPQPTPEPVQPTPAPAPQTLQDYYTTGASDASTVGGNGGYAGSVGVNAAPEVLAGGGAPSYSTLNDLGYSQPTYTAPAPAPVQDYYNTGASDASTVGGEGGYAGSVGAGAGPEVLASDTPWYSELTDAGYSTPTAPVIKTLPGEAYPGADQFTPIAADPLPPFVAAPMTPLPTSGQPGGLTPVTPYNPVTLGDVKNAVGGVKAVDSLLGGGGSGGSGGSGTGGGSGGGLGGLGGIIGGLLGGGTGGLNDGLLGMLSGMYLGDRTNSELNSQIDKLENMYSLNSPYATQLRQQLERKDAAGGRNSQYGPREVELLARMADVNTKNAPLIQELYKHKAANRNLTAQSALRSGITNQLTQGGGTLVDGIKKLFNSGDNGAKQAEALINSGILGSKTPFTNPTTGQFDWNNGTPFSGQQVNSGDVASSLTGGSSWVYPDQGGGNLDWTGFLTNSNNGNSYDWFGTGSNNMFSGQDTTTLPSIGLGGGSGSVFDPELDTNSLGGLFGNGSGGNWWDEP